MFDFARLFSRKRQPEEQAHQSDAEPAQQPTAHTLQPGGDLEEDLAQQIDQIGELLAEVKAVRTNELSAGVNEGGSAAGGGADHSADSERDQQQPSVAEEPEQAPNPSAFAGDEPPSHERGGDAVPDSIQQAQPQALETDAVPTDDADEPAPTTHAPDRTMSVDDSTETSVDAPIASARSLAEPVVTDPQHDVTGDRSEGHGAVTRLKQWSQLAVERTRGVVRFAAHLASRMNDLDPRTRDVLGFFGITAGLSAIMLLLAQALGWI